MPVAIEPQQLRERAKSFSQQSETSQTAQEFINSQLRLEEEAREALPYQFDTCTKPLGPLRQLVFSCLTCNPPPTDLSAPYKPAGVCYSCSISCHGDHTLVELFNKRDFVCDCGTSRLPDSAPCTLRIDPATGTKRNVHSETPREGNSYNHNFRNRFCGCGEEYDPYQEKGTMFQCLGLGSEASGGCGEDWWHPECVMGLPRNWAETQPTSASHPALGTEVEVPPAAGRVDSEEELPLPPGFPAEDDFESFICYKCVESNPWIRDYAGSSGFLPAIFFKNRGANELGELPPSHAQSSSQTSSQKRKAPDDDGVANENVTKKLKPVEESTNGHAGVSGTESTEADAQSDQPRPCKQKSLPSAPSGKLSLFLREDFRDHLCKCAGCFPILSKHPYLLEEEDTYEPPVSESDHAAADQRSAGSRSLLDMGEAALSNVDRVRAIEGVMAYNKLKEKVKSFLQPFAESGQAVSAEDVKKYFEQLRGDQAGIQAAAQSAEADAKADNRKEGEGY